MQEEQKKKEDTLYSYITEYRSSLKDYYDAIYEYCEDECLELVTGMFDILNKKYSKETIIDKLYDLYHYDEREEYSEIMYQIYNAFKEDYNHSIIKFGDMLGDDEKEVYYKKYSEDIVYSVFRSDTFDEIRYNVTRTTLKYVSRFIFKFFLIEKLDEIRGEEE